MKAQWRRLDHWLNAQPRQMRLLLFGLTLFVLFILWYLVLQGPVMVRSELTSNAIAKSKRQTTKLQKQLKLIAAHNDKDPRISLKLRRKELRDTIAVLDSRLDLHFVSLGSSQKVLDILGSVLKKAKSVHLKQLESLPTEPLLDNYEDLLAPGKQETLVKQGVLLKFTSDYFSTMNYFRQLNQTRTHFFWDELTYKVTHYPEALVTAKLYFVRHEEKSTKKARKLVKLAASGNTVVTVKQQVKGDDNA